MSGHPPSSAKVSARLCLYLLDDSVPNGSTLLELFPLTAPLLGGCQDKPLGGRRHWNLGRVEDDGTTSSDMIHSFEAHVKSEIQCPSGKQLQTRPMAQNGTVECESGQPRRKRYKANKTSVGENSDTDRAIREYADSLVAIKQDCDSMTWLFALSRLTRSNIVRATVLSYKLWQEACLKGKSAMQIREGLPDKVARISSITQRENN